MYVWKASSGLYGYEELFDTKKRHEKIKFLHIETVNIRPSTQVLI